MVSLPRRLPSGRPAVLAVLCRRRPGWHVARERNPRGRPAAPGGAAGRACPQAGNPHLQRSVGGRAGPHFVTPPGSQRLRCALPTAARTACSQGVPAGAQPPAADWSLWADCRLADDCRTAVQGTRRTGWRAAAPPRSSAIRGAENRAAGMGTPGGPVTPPQQLRPTGTRGHRAAGAVFRAAERGPGGPQAVRRTRSWKEVRLTTVDYCVPL